MKKVIFFSTIFTLVAGSVFFYKYNMSNTTDINETKINSKYNKQTLIEVDKKTSNLIESASEKSQVTYNTKFSVKFAPKEKLSITPENRVSFKLSFLPKENNFYYGIAYDFTHDKSNISSAIINTEIKKIGFTLQRFENGDIKNIDLLGLPQDHPFYVIKNIVGQFIHAADGTTKEIELKDGTYTYTYKKIGPNKTKRILNNVNYNDDSKSFINSHYESWFIEHSKNNWPQRMSFKMDREVNFQNGILAINQAVLSNQIKVPRISDWDNKSIFAHNANAIYEIAPLKDGPLSKPEKINDEKEFNEALAKLDKALDPGLAKEIGLYLLNELDLREIMALLIDDERSTEHHAHIIYGIQKVGTHQAEQYLGEIAANSDISSLNRQRAIVSSGLFDNASQTSIDNLSNLIGDPDKSVSNAAILNLGNISSKSPELDNQIRDILLHNLETSEDPYNSILAISNTNNPVYDKHILKYINDERFHVREAAYSIIARRREFQSIVLKALLEENHPNVIAKIANTIKNYNNLPLPQEFLPKLRQRILGNDHPVIINRLLYFYLEIRKIYRYDDKEFLKLIVNKPSISDSSKKVINDILLTL